ncbi:MAG: SpoIIE family protein phosphatase [Microscillaceae bacterium]|jgi:serine phosphatase RsbU (regulator of sigma subunit)|nr:SpoIIE family protein phosphatase [Microscillaceae bacterium]
MNKILYHLLFFVGFLAFFYTETTAQAIYLKTLLKQLKSARAEKKVDLFNRVAEFYKPFYPDSSLIYGDSAIALALALNYQVGRADANTIVGVVQFEAGNIDFALSYFEKALSVYEKQKNYTQWARILNNMGEVYLSKSRTALQSDSIQVGIYKQKAYQFFRQALRLSEQYADQEGLMFGYIGFANWHKTWQKNDSAVFYYQKSLKVAQARQDNDAIARNYINLADVQKQKGDKGLAMKLNLLQKALKYVKIIQSSYHLAFTLNKISQTFLEYERLDSAAFYADQAMKIGYQNTPFLNKEIQKSYESSIQAAILQNQSEKAFGLFFGYTQILRDESKLIARSAINYLHQEELIQEKVNQQNRFINLILGLLLFLALAFLLYVIFNIRKQKKINRVLAQQKQSIEDYAQNLQILNTQVTQQKEELFIKNRNIEDSINYAQRIQQASLPPINEIEKTLADFFVFYRPRNIVSGDFYWFGHSYPKSAYPSTPEQNADINHLTSEKTIIIAADCTGHGVPGAFMSMIGNTLLDEIVYVLNITEPDLILGQLHHKIRDVLRQHQTDVRDGMDIAVCVIDFTKNELAYAGARSPLVVVQGEEIKIIGADRIPVGGENYEQMRSFTRHIIPLESTVSSAFYMFSDGYIDQFGGNERKKFMRANLVKYIQEIHHLPMSQQKESFIQKFDEWKIDEEQVDDVLLLGFRI